MASSSAKLLKYKGLLTKLLPKGRLWKPTEQPTFSAYLGSISEELCRVDDRVKQMLLEVDPRTTDEAVDQWEGVLGLPDECSPDDQDLADRRTQITQKLTNIGGLSKTFYEFLGNQLGYDIDVNNYVNFVAGRGKAGDPITNYFNRHFVAGSKAGDFLTEIGWRFYYNVDIPVAAAEHFVAGSVAGTPLRLFSNELIQCTMTKLKPAHAMPFFTFKE